MPRLDRTFTGEDVLRIWLNNLDSDERELVSDVILGLSSEFLDETLDFLTRVGGLVPFFGEFAEIAGLVVDVVQLNRAYERARRAAEIVERLRR